LDIAAGHTPSGDFSELEGRVKALNQTLSDIGGRASSAHRAVASSVNLAMEHLRLATSWHDQKDSAYRAAEKDFALLAAALINEASRVCPFH
jgi:hypothetical protein